MKRFLCLLLLLAFPAFGAHFQDSNGLIIISDNNAEFSVDSSEFSAYEPTYEAPPDGAIRIWTDAYQCLQKDGNQTGDPFYSADRFAAYVANIAAYQAAYDAAHMEPTPTPEPYIYADVQVSADRIKITGEKITFQAWLKDTDGTILPVSESWIIRLRNASGDEIDAFPIEFTDGVTPVMDYSIPPHTPLGRVFILESDFEPVDVPGLGSVAVKLLNPVQFTIYRQL